MRGFEVFAFSEIEILCLTSSDRVGIIGSQLHQTSHFHVGDPTQEDGMFTTLQRLWFDDSGQDIAEYAVMLAVILVLVVGTVRLIGSNANTAFSEAASSVQ
jgi:Flp pilus assembly pilin Flp